MVKTFHTCSHLFTPVHTRSHLFTTVHTCSHLTDYLRSSRNGSFSLNFSLAKLLFFDLTGYLFEIAYFAHLIESCPTVHSLSSCVEKKISIPLVAHTTVTMYVNRSHFLRFRMLLFFSITSYPAEIAHFNSPDRELSNFVRLMELY